MPARDLHIGEFHPREPISGILGWFAVVSRWRKRIQRRHELVQLDAWSRRDLGLSSSDIWLEANKRPWQA